MYLLILSVTFVFHPRVCVCSLLLYYVIKCCIMMTK